MTVTTQEPLHVVIPSMPDHDARSYDDIASAVEVRAAFRSLRQRSSS